MYNVGDKVHYRPFDGCHNDDIENGVISTITEDSRIFVVFKCGENWDNFHQYTGQLTNPKNIEKGWYGFTPILFGFRRDGYWYEREDNSYCINQNTNGIFSIREMGSWDHGNILYSGKIPTNKFALELFSNMNILPDSEIIKINRELIIDDVMS